MRCGMRAARGGASHAAAAAVAGAVRTALAGRDRRHLPGAALGPSARDRPAAGGGTGASAADRRRPAERAGRPVHRQRAAGDLRAERPAGPGHVLCRGAQRRRGGDPAAPQPAADAAPRVVGRAAAGGWPVRAGGSRGTDRHRPGRPAGWPGALPRC
ncbi:hypothetical protein G6F64_013812 [Rhizopus arrhizus]|uniref:Uncharacterized protein n=1 Tax=Rhizopus oryzae TaxID=64495 RepID=A0A9P6WUS1_RHIOR|nr:hypothetical protein G6F64_013812 [Rhizopus arrhizus]